MSAEKIPLDMYLSTKMRQKFDSQELFNEKVKMQILFCRNDIESLYEKIFRMQQTIDRLCEQK